MKSTRRQRMFWVAAWAICLFAPAGAFADLVMQSDRQEVDIEKQIVTLTGNVRVETREGELRAAKVVFDEKSREAVAQKDVVFLTPRKERIETQKLQLKLGRRVAELPAPFVFSSEGGRFSAAGGVLDLQQKKLTARKARLQEERLELAAEAVVFNIEAGSGEAQGDVIATAKGEAPLKIAAQRMTFERKESLNLTAWEARVEAEGLHLKGKKLTYAEAGGLMVMEDLKEAVRGETRIEGDVLKYFIQENRLVIEGGGKVVVPDPEPPSP